MGSKVFKGLKLITVIMFAVVLMCSLLLVTACKDGDAENVASIEVIKDSVPEIARVGEFDITAIKLLVTYDDGSTKTINAQNAMLTNEAKLSLSTEGKKNLTLSYGKQAVIVEILLVAEGTETVSVTFVDEAGSVIVKKAAIKGKEVVAPKAPEVKDKIFIGWVDTAGQTANLSKVDADMTVRASYSLNAKTYTVTFYDNNGKEISSVTVQHGDKISAPSWTLPAGAISVDWGFDWNTPITNNMNISATVAYQTRTIAYKYQYTDDMVNVTPTPLDFSEIVKYKDKPAKKEEAKRLLQNRQMTFVKWLNESDVDNGTSDVLIAQVKARTFTISFPDCNHPTVTINAGVSFEFYEYSSNTKVGYDFAGKWKDKSTGAIYEGGKEYKINSDLVLEGVYTLRNISTQFTVTFKGKTDLHGQTLIITKNITSTVYNQLINRDFISKEVLTAIKKDGTGTLANYEIEYVEFNVSGENYSIMDSNGYRLTDSAAYFNVYCYDKEAGTAGLSYEINGNNDGYLVSGYNPSNVNWNVEQNIYIPKNYNGKPIVGIKANAFFRDGGMILYINMPDTVTEIGEGAFKGVTFCSDVNFPVIKTLGANAFENAKSNVSDGITISFASGTGAFAAVPEKAFYKHSGIKKIVLPNTVTDIGANAFVAETANADKILLNELNLSTVKNLGDYALMGNTALKNVVNTDLIETIGLQAFSKTGLTTLSLPALKSIGNLAFSEMADLITLSVATASAKGTALVFSLDTLYLCYKLETLTLGQGVTGITSSVKLSVNNDYIISTINIGKNVVDVEFDKLSGFGKITTVTTVAGGKYVAVNNVVFEGATLVYYPTGVFGDYTVPQKVNNVVVTGIAPNAFENSAINRLTVNNRLITRDAIGGKITVVSMPVVEMDVYFTEFAGEFETRIKGIFGTDTKYLLTGTMTAEQVTRYAGYAFITANESEVGYYYDATTKLLYMINADDMAVVLSGDPKATSITIPATLGGKAVVELAPNAFKGYKYLQSITINANLKSLANAGVFAGCTALAKVTILAIDADGAIDKNMFNDTAWYASTNLLVAGKRLIAYNNEYKLNDEYVTVITASQFGDAIEIPSEFFKGSRLTEVTLSNKIKTLGDEVFADCVNLKSINLNSVTFTGNKLFANCSNLISAIIPLTINGGAVPIEMFANCVKLESVSFNGMTHFATMEKGVAKIYSGAFYNCAVLADISFLNGFIRIADQVFEGCNAITALDTTVDGWRKIATIGYRAFYNCSSLTSLIVLASETSVTNIGSEAFYNCANLKTVTFVGRGGIFLDPVDGEVRLGANAISKNSDTKIYVDSGNGILEKAKLLFPEYSVNTTVPAVDFFRKDTNKKLLDTIVTSYINVAPQAPAFSGFIFDGWFINDVKVEFPFVVEQNVTMYAKYYDVKKGSLVDSNVHPILGDEGKLIFDGQYDVDADTIYIPATYGDKPIVAIDMKVFDGCTKLKRLVLPEGIKVISGTNNSSLEYVYVPASVQKIEDGALANNAKLEIEFANGSELILASEASFTGTKWFNDNVTLAKEKQNGGFVIAGRMAIGYYGVKEGVALLSVVVPTQVIKLADNLFKNNTEIGSIRLNDKLLYIGNNCFMGATGLSSVTYESFIENSSLISVAKNAFDDTPWETKQNMVIVGGSLLNYNDLSGATTVYLPTYVKIIMEGAFRNARVQNLMFTGSKLTTIGDYAFEGSELVEITLPATVRELGKGIFKNCLYLINADLRGAKIENLPENTFDGCERLETLKLNVTVKSLGEKSLNKCVNLGTITADGINSIARLYGEVESGASGLMNTAWAKQSSETQATSLVLGKVFVKYVSATTVDANYVHNTVVTIPAGVEAILQNAFKGNRIITEVVIPGSVKLIGTGAFDGCANLQTVTFGAGSYLTDIEERAFAETGIGSITLPGNLLHIGAGAFFNTKLTSITIPDTVLSIGDNAFRNNKLLETVVLGKAVEELGNFAFADNVSLYKVNWALDKVEVEDSPNEFTVKQLEMVYASKGSIQEEAYKQFIKNLFVRSEGFEDNVKIRMYIPSQVVNLIESMKASSVRPYIYNWSNVSDSFMLKQEGEYPEVIFDSQKGGYAMSNIKTELIESLPTPAKSNCTFVGWFLDEAYTRPLILPFKVNTVTNVYAKWYENDRTSASANEILGYSAKYAEGGSSILEGYVIDSINYTKPTSEMEALGGTKYSYSVNYTLYVPSTYEGKKVIGFNMPEDAATREVTKLVFTNASNVVINDNNIFNIFLNLKEIVILGDTRASFVVDNSVVYNNDKSKLIAYLSGKEVKATYDSSTAKTEYTLVKDNGVTSFAVPKTVKSINSYAFANSALTSVSIGKALTQIGDKAFNKEVQDISFEKGIKMVDVTKESFNNTEWYKQTAKTPYQPMGSVVGFFYAAANVLLEYEQTASTASLSLPSTVNGISINVIGSKLLNRASNASTIEFNEIILPLLVERINSQAFYKMDFKNVGGDKYTKLNYIANDVFDGTKYIEVSSNQIQLGTILLKASQAVSDIVVPSGVTAIAAGAFKDTQVVTVTLPDSLLTIGDRAFFGCQYLSKVAIPGKVASLGEEIFANCKELKEVTFGRDSVLTAIGNLAFNNCRKLDNITLPYTVTKIGKEAFAACVSLKTVIFDKVEIIGTGTEAVTKITPSLLSDLGESAFEGCQSLSNISIPNGLKKIAKATFKDCTGLINVKFDISNSNVQIIETQSFSGCVKLGSIIDVAKPKLETVALPNELITIEDKAFEDCKGMFGIELFYHISNIGTEVFAGCENLAKIKVNTSNPATIKADAFKREKVNSTPRYALRIYVPISSSNVPMATLNNYKTKWSAYAKNIFEFGSYPVLTYTKKTTTGDGMIKTEEVKIEGRDLIVNPSCVFPSATTTYTSWVYTKIGDKSTSEQDSRIGMLVESAVYRQQSNAGGGVDIILVIDDVMILSTKQSIG